MIDLRGNDVYEIGIHEVCFKELIDRGMEVSELILGKGFTIQYRRPDGSKWNLVVTHLPNSNDTHDLRNSMINAITVKQQPLWKIITENVHISRAWHGNYVDDSEENFYFDTLTAIDWLENKANPLTVRNKVNINKMLDLAKIGRKQMSVKIGRKQMSVQSIDFKNYQTATCILRDLRTEYLQQVFFWVGVGGLEPSVIQLKKNAVARYGQRYMYSNVVNEITGEQLFVEPAILSSGKTMYRITTNDHNNAGYYSDGYYGWSDTMSRISAFITENQRKEIVKKLFLNYTLDLA